MTVSTPDTAAPHRALDALLAHHRETDSAAEVPVSLGVLRSLAAARSDIHDVFLQKVIRRVTDAQRDELVPRMEPEQVMSLAYQVRGAVTEELEELQSECLHLLVRLRMTDGGTL